jgi:chromosome segregation ATPase
MADLETTAGEALVAVRQLEGQITDANARLDQLREGSLDSIEEQCESVWGRLEDQLKAFLQHLHDVEGVLHELGRDAAGTLSGTRDVLSQAYAAAEAHLGEAASGVVALGEQVEAVGPEVASLLQGLEGGAHELETELTRVETELEEAAECQGPVEAAEIDWSAKLVEVLGTVEQTFTGAGEHAQKVVAYSLWKCEEAFKETLGELQQAAEVVEKSLDALREEADLGKGEDTQAADAVDGSVQETIAALGTAGSSIAHALTELAKYSWGGP